MSQYQDEWFAKAEQLGHSLKRNSDGEVDDTWYSQDFCNGPSCSKCLQSWCMYCTNSDEIPECK